MKSPTEHYRKLRVTLGEIRVIMRSVPQLTCDSKLHHLKVQSYILLCHAAFEEYVEELVRLVSTEAIRLLNEELTITRTLISMTACETIAQLDESVARKKIKSDVASNFETFANLAKINFHKQIDENHGIRGLNLRSLFLPIGIDPEACDLPTFSALDALGLKRGNIAHKVIIKRSETRSSILSETDVIFRGLLEYDIAAVELLRQRMKK